jgi:anti-sigma B factor antagonist
MESKIEENDSIAVLRLKGRFDAHEVIPAHASILGQIDKGNVNIIINLEGVNFIDSTALSFLVRWLKNCRERGGDLHLCKLQQPVRVIFELTRLDKAFEIYALEYDAEAAFK